MRNNSPVKLLEEAANQSFTARFRNAKLNPTTTYEPEHTPDNPDASAPVDAGPAPVSDEIRARRERYS